MTVDPNATVGPLAELGAMLAVRNGFRACNAIVQVSGPGERGFRFC